MNKVILLAVTALLITALTASSASAMYYYNTNSYDSSYYYQNHWFRNGWDMWSQYPGGTFWSPQPVASTPLYSYYNTDYYGYNPSYPGYGYPTYNYPAYGNNNNYCPVQYYDGSKSGQTSYYYDCRGRMAYPQGSQPASYSYYRNDPYNTGYNANYPNYLSYGWQY